MEPNAHAPRAENARGSKRSSEVRVEGVQRDPQNNPIEYAENKRVRLQPPAISTISDSEVLASDAGGIETGSSTVASATGVMDVVTHPLVEGIMALYQSDADDAVPYLLFSSYLLFFSYPVPIESLLSSALQILFAFSTHLVSSLLFASLHFPSLLFTAILCEHIQTHTHTHIGYARNPKSM
jgi:hypothetical protein